MIVSSLSLSLLVRAIIMSLYFSKSCLYLSTYYLSSSIWIRSFSISCIFSSNSFLRILYFSSKALLNWGVSSIFLPPMSICEFMALIFVSKTFFASFSCMNSRDLSSSAVIAAFLSSSALLFSLSSLKICSELMTEVFLCSSSYFSLLSSISYFLRRALWSISSLILASFLIFLALVANLRVD